MFILFHEELFGTISPKNKSMISEEGNPMKKFLKTCHVISRVLLYLCVISTLLLYFFKPGVLEMAKNILPAVSNGAWLATVTVVAAAAVMFSFSDLAYERLQNNEFLVKLSSSVLKSVFEENDIDNRRIEKVPVGEKDFNASLRDVADGRERILRELAWEKQHSKKLQKQIVGNKIVMLIFLVAGLAFLAYPVVYYFRYKEMLSMPTGTLLDYCSLLGLILTMVIILEIGSNRGLLRRLNTILSIRDRHEELKTQPAVTAVPFVTPVPAPAPYTAPQQSASETSASPVPQEETVSAAVPAPASAPAQEEVWHPEPAWTGVPEEEEKTESAFVNLTPDEAAATED